jgi:predicted O-methyltransferase YrrM
MQRTLWEGDTTYGHYQVVDAPYNGRPARVLYSGDRQAAQSGIPQDDDPDLLFDYNQRLLELASNLQPKKLLVIGGGMFTLPTALLAALPDTTIDVIEIDPGLTDIATKFFGLPKNDRLTIFNTDGRAYLTSHATKYDMIIIDAFKHASIPKDIKTIQAFKAYSDHLTDHGVLAMNAISGYYGLSAHVLQELHAGAIRSFDVVDIFLASRGYSLWLPQNFVFTAQKGAGEPLKDYVCHDAIVPPEFQPDMALDD